ncbi:MAG: SCO family protein [Phycisphaerales bacterium]|nr:SCO family protein [Phycisphaerales bacterium]
MRRGRVHLAVALAGLVLAGGAAAQLNQLPRQLRGVDVVERLGQAADLSVEVTDSTGRRGPLASFAVPGKPVILVMGYYDCPLVCPLVLDKLLERLNTIDFTIGRDYSVVMVSFDPDNTTAMAASYADTYRTGYRPGKSTPTVAAGFTFTTTTEEGARALAGSIGERYNFLPESGEYSHPVVFTVLTPDGQVSRYIYGFGYVAQDVRLALLEASEGKIAQGVMDRLLLYCFHWDPTRGGYSLTAFRVMQLGALATTTGLAALVAGLVFFDRRRRSARELAASAPDAALTGHSA